MTHTELQQDLALYALGALDEVTSHRLETHLSQGCGECAAQLVAWQSAANQIPYSLTPVQPPPAVKQRLMARIQEAGQSGQVHQASAPIVEIRADNRVAANSAQSRGATSKGASSRLSWLGWAAAAVLLVAFGFALVWQQKARQRYDQEAAFINFLQAKDTRLVTLTPSPGASGQYSAQVALNSTQHYWAVVNDDLPAVSAAKAYQLWFIAGGKPISGGLLSAPSADTRLAIPPGVKNVDEVAISLEPAGGSSQPQGPIILVGRINNTSDKL